MLGISRVFLLFFTHGLWLAAGKSQKNVVRNQRMVVSAHGALQEQEQLEEEAADEPMLSPTVHKVLLEVEDMAETHAAIDQDKIKVIQDIVVKDLMPELKNTRDAAEKQVNKNIDAVKKCNSNQQQTLTRISSTAEKSVDQHRTEHSACRDEEKVKEGVKDTKCGELDSFLNDVNLPSNMPANKPRTQMVKYVETMSAYFCPKGPKVTDLNTACKDAEKQHQDQKVECNQDQFTFESDFCQWKTQLNDACSAQTTCYDDAVSGYTSHKTATETLIKKWKVEYAALSKIKCYTDVWLSDKNAKTVDADQLAKCNADEVDTSPMDIDFKKVPEKAVCDMSAVAIYPGDPGFPQKEYANFINYATGSIACLGAAPATAQGGRTDPDAETNYDPAAPTVCEPLEGDTYNDEGAGKCVTADGADPVHTYLHGTDAASCKAGCSSDARCYGYSVSSHGNCLHWNGCNVKGGGAAWGGAHCFIKQSTPPENAPVVPLAPSKGEFLPSGNLGSGIACQDSAKGSGFIMYSKENVHTRFKATPVHKDNANHFVCVRYNKGWVYDTNSKDVAFTPTNTDVLVANADFTGDKVFDLEGSSGMYQNVKHGYASGDLVFHANKWDPARYAKGEFTVVGEGFYPQASYMNSNFISAGDIGNGIACQDNGKGSGYIMYSKEDLHTRFKAKPIHNDGAHHFVCVQHSGGKWNYDTNSVWVPFTPASTDVLVAATDYTEDKVSDLKGKSGNDQGIAKGYKSGDLKFTANKWDPQKYGKGEFHVSGTGFTK